MIGAPNTRGQKYWVGIVQWAPKTFVSEEIADIFRNYNIDYIVWDDITHPFPNFKGCTVEVWEWISNFIPYCARPIITYPFLGLKLIHVFYRVPGDSLGLWGRCLHGTLGWNYIKINDPASSNSVCIWVVIATYIKWTSKVTPSHDDIMTWKCFLH